MKKVFFLLITLSIFVFGNYHDTGYIKWTQPNGVNFTARQWGDEFFHWFETIDGYQVKMGLDYFYYYAVLDENGQFYPSKSRVGVDQPLAESYKLDRNEKGIQWINERIEEFNAGIMAQPDRGLGKITGAPTTLNVGVVLVEFSDTLHYTNDDWENGYLKDHFNDMMFSSNHYWDSDELYNDIHPEGNRIYGSFRDYWYEQSNGHLLFTSNSGVVNSQNPDGTPIWYQLSHTKAYYDAYYSAIWPIESELSLDTLSYDKIIIIYAGNMIYGGGLTPHTYMNGRYSILGERQTPGSNDKYVFNHIGAYCHEFGHQIGFQHTCYSSAGAGEYTPVYHFNVMSVGDMNGPTKNCECPAGLNPYFKSVKGWISFADEIDNDIDGLEILYDYDNQIYYKVEIQNSDQFFILENRLRNGFDQYTPIGPSYSSPYQDDPNGNQGGLLVWHIRPGSISSVLYTNQLELADNDPAMTNQSYVRDQFPMIQGQNFNDISTPDSQLRGSQTGEHSHVAIHDIQWDDVNKTKTVDIYTNAWAGTVDSNTTWSGEDVYIYGDLMIASNVVVDSDVDIYVAEGATLTCNSGSQIKFAQGKQLHVYGSIVTNGTSVSPVVFTRDDPNSTDKQYWQGIIINSGASYTFDYVKMYGAYYGIKPNYTSGTISNSHFEQNYIGTYLYHVNNTNIHNCEFIDNQYGTMASYSSNLNFQNNSYDSNDYYGIYFNRSTGTFKNNVIENNSTHGFNIDNQCDVDMNTWFEYDEDPTINNTIQNNASDGMWIGDGDIDLGTYLNIGTDFRGGFNYFNHGSGYLDIRYRGNDDMKAEANWWEDMAVDWDFGEIDTDPTANDLGYSLPKSVNGSDSYYTDDLLNKAYYLEKVDSNYVEAIDILNKAADIAPDDPIVQKIVLRLKRLYTKLSNKKGLLKNLDELYNSYPDQLIGITAYDHSVTLFADELNFDEALERSNKLTEKYSNYSKSKEKNAWALLEQGMLYIDTKGKLSNNVQAQSSFTKLLTQV